MMPLSEKRDLLKGKDRRKGIFYCPHCGRLLRKINTTINVYYECARGSYEDVRASPFLWTLAC